MSLFEAFVINLVLLVQISQTHTVPPTIVEKFEPFNGDDDVLQVNQNNNTFPAMAQPVTNDFDPLKPSEPLITDANNDTKSSNEDELVFAHVVSDFQILNLE